MFGNLIKFIKDVLFPQFCVGCEKEGEFICDECLGAELQKNKVTQSCPVCEKNNLFGEVCEHCRVATYIDGVVAFFSYKEKNALAKLIQRYKYNYIKDIEDTWRRIICFDIDDERWRLLFDKYFKNKTITIVPVPLHRRRVKERGFNQADIIVDCLITKLQNFGFYCLLDKKNLQRRRYTKQQALLTRAERLVNLKDAFAWQVLAVAPDNIILVDDVYTTGATMNECAKVLKKNGAKSVWGVALARGV